MRALLKIAAALGVMAFVPGRASGASIGLINTFESGTTEGWFAGGLGMGMLPPTPPQNIATGGPAGVNDNFLQITSTGSAGPGSKLVAINGTQWAGNYLAARIGAIVMDLKNLGTTDLTIRLLFEDPMGGPPADQAVTTFGAFLPSGGGWTHVSFPVTPPNLTPLAGNLNTLLSNTTLLRIIDSPTPTDAVTIAGTLGVDNIGATAVPEPSTLLFTVTGLVVVARRYRRRIKAIAP